MVIKYILIKPTQAAELVHLMDDDTSTKIELRKKLKEDPEVWEKVIDLFRRSEMIRWKIRDIIGMGLFKGLSSNPFSSLDDDETSDTLYFCVAPPYFWTPPMRECYDPDISEITWLTKYDGLATPDDQWAYARIENSFGEPNPEMRVYLKDAEDRMDPVITSAGKIDLVQILAGHSDFKVDDYYLWLSSNSMNETIVIREKHEPDEYMDYDIVEDENDNVFITRVFRKRESEVDSAR